MFCKHDTEHTNTVCVVKCSFSILDTAGGAYGYLLTGNLTTNTVQHGVNIYSDNGGNYYYYYANCNRNSY